MSNLILIGFKGCGKTTFGQKLAYLAERRFIDTDVLLEEKHQMSCRELYLHVGEEGFRQAELEVVGSLKGERNCVIALGGGTPVDPSWGDVIYLKVKKEVVKERLFSKPLPPFIKSEEEFERVFDERVKYYEKVCSYTIEL